MVHTHRTSLLSGCLLAATLVVAGCRGTPSEQEPVHPIRNMYQQPRYNPQGKSDFFGDGRAMRPLVAGTVPREAYVDPEVETGWSDAQETWALTVPDAVVGGFGGMRQLLERGEDRYGIYCTPCHGVSGEGDGPVPTRAAGPIRPPTLHGDRVRHMPDGQVFATVTNGVRNMPAYGHMLSVEDRWAIVGYVRALELSVGANEARQ